MEPVRHGCYLSDSVMASGREGNFLEPLNGRYCLFCSLDVIKDSASALWKAVVIGSEMLGLSKDMGC